MKHNFVRYKILLLTLMTFLNRWAWAIFMFSKIFLCSNHFKLQSYFLIKNNLLISETVMKLSSSSGNTWECEVMVNYRRCPHPPTGLPPSPLGFPTLISALVRLRSWGRRQAVTSAGTSVWSVWDCFYSGEEGRAVLPGGITQMKPVNKLEVAAK